MGSAASISDSVAQLSEEEAVNHLLTLYKSDKDKVERIIAKAKLKQLEGSAPAEAAGRVSAPPPTQPAPSTTAEPSSQAGTYTPYPSPSPCAHFHNPLRPSSPAPPPLPP
jgi:hypothetical protein